MKIKTPVALPSSPFNPRLHPMGQTTLIGHQSACEQLRRAFHNNAMHPVWLIVGERGIGKATFAYAMAREIFGQEGQDGAFVARRMSQGTHPNFLALERGLNEEGKGSREINAEEGRKVNAFLRQHAAIPGRRVVVIDAVDEMNRTAAHALLKILEEPPAQTLFFLIAHSLGQTLPTIRSRCCKLHLFPLRDEEIQRNLEPAISPDLLPFARGSMGRAIALQEAGGQKLLASVAQALAGALRGDWGPAQALSASFDKDNPRCDVLLDLIIGVIHHLTLLAHLPASGVVADAGLSHLAKLKAITHWVDALHRISQFLEGARTSHLDRAHVVMAVFFMVENPTAGDEFIYGSF